MSFFEIKYLRTEGDVITFIGDSAFDSTDSGLAFPNTVTDFPYLPGSPDKAFSTAHVEVAPTDNDSVNFLDKAFPEDAVTSDLDSVMDSGTGNNSGTDDGDDDFLAAVFEKNEKVEDHSNSSVVSDFIGNIDAATPDISIVELEISTVPGSPASVTISGGTLSSVNSGAPSTSASIDSILSLVQAPKKAPPKSKLPLPTATTSIVTATKTLPYSPAKATPSVPLSLRVPPMAVTREYAPDLEETLTLPQAQAQTAPTACGPPKPRDAPSKIEKPGFMSRLLAPVNSYGTRSSRLQDRSYSPVATSKTVLPRRTNDKENLGNWI
jgi:hypothetical protein